MELIFRFGKDKSKQKTIDKQREYIKQLEEEIKRLKFNKQRILVGNKKGKRKHVSNKKKI